MIYQPFKGKLDDGTEVLVTMQVEFGADDQMRESVELAFRPVGARTWGPPVQLERAP